MTYIIRKVREDEKEAFISLTLGLTQFNIDASSKVLSEQEINSHFAKSRERFGNIFDQTLEQDQQSILVVEMDGELIGYTLTFIEKDEALINELFLKKEARGLGIGKGLMDQTLNWIKEKGVSRVVLKVYAWNRHAIEFYEKEGFSPYYHCYKKDL